MIAKAITKYVRVSPFKLRPIVDVIRGKPVGQALAWLKTSANRRFAPITKVIDSACANARHKGASDAQMASMRITSICVDHGPIIKYMKPAAMGRSCVIRKRSSHITVVVGE